MSAHLLHHHSVKFYADDASLFRTVSGFLADGLAKGQPAIVIATDAHRDGIIDYLCNHLIDCDRAIENGALVIRGADETLAAFMVDGRPVRELFDASVGALVADTAARHGGSVIRAYGEMVDVLWRAGARDAAIALETLWNELAAKYHFALLCGYAMGNFYKEAHMMETVKRQHTHSFDATSVAIPLTS